MVKLKWKTEKRKIKDLIPYNKNPRTLTELQRERLTTSLKKFDLAEIPAVDRDNTIVAGHQRLKILLDLGKGEEIIDVRIPSRKLSKQEFEEYNLRSNKNTGEWDIDMLGKFDIDLLKNVGFSSDELDNIFKPEDKPEDDEIPEVPQEAISKLGDIYQLGNHRLMCGDSTSESDVSKLMDGNKADMVFTDPPYGINVKGDRSLRGGICQGNKLKDFKDDSIKYAVKAFNICDSLNIPRQVWWGANYYCHHIPMSNNWFVWDKRVEEKQKDTQSDCELAWVKSKWNSVRIFRHLWKGMMKGSEMGQKRIHPTQKPIALVEWSFNYFKTVNIVLDLFGGSGSTLIACEKTKRICYMMELDPLYVDVIVKRWEDYTGNKAILL